MKLTLVQHLIYNSINYSWKSLYELEKLENIDIIKILNELTELGLIEKKRKWDVFNCYYRRANKRILVG